MKRFLPVFFLMFLFAAATARPVDVQQIMVRFDQAYIPLWFATETGDLKEAKATVAYAEFRWQQMERTLLLVLPEGEWIEHLQRTGEWMNDAYWAIQRGDLATAAIELDHARFELMAMRRQLGIHNYYPDQLYQLHSSLDILAEISEDPKLCLLDWNEFERLVTQAVTDWANIRDHRPDAQTYELTDDQITGLSQLSSELDKAMEHLVREMQRAQRLDVARAVQAADAILIERIRIFGRFDPTSVLFAEPLREGAEQKESKTF